MPARKISQVAVTPCLLPTNFLYDRGSYKLYSYEFYHPLVVAWQFGLEQLPIHLFFMEHIRTRYIISIAMEYNRLKALTDDLTNTELVNWAPSLAPFSS
jgi:hypothetical protein